MYNTDSSTKPSDTYFIKNIPRGQTKFERGQNGKEKKRICKSPCGYSSELFSGETGILAVQTMHTVGYLENSEPVWQLLGSYIPFISAQYQQASGNHTATGIKSSVFRNTQRTTFSDKGMCKFSACLQ